MERNDGGKTNIIFLYFYKIIGKTSFYFQSFQNRGVFFVTLFDSRDKDMLIWLHFQQTSFLLKVNNDGSYIVVFTFMVGRPAGRERGAEENKILKCHSWDLWDYVWDIYVDFSYGYLEEENSQFEIFDELPLCTLWSGSMYLTNISFKSICVL